MDASGAAAEMLLADGFARFKISSEVATAISRAFAASHKFFDLPLHEKVQNRLARDLGYRPYGIEYSASAAHPDQIESFSVGHRIAASEANLSSPEAQALYSQAADALSLLELIAERIVVDLAKQIAPNADTSNFGGGLRDWSTLQLNRSVEPQIATDQLSELHEDGCLLTLMTHDGPGLEIRNPDGSFSDLTISKDELLAIPGEILTLLSGGTVQPLYHRVKIAPNSAGRMALLFFADLEPRLCRPWIQSNDEKNIGERVLKNGKRYGLPEWEF